jgi:N-hydroxyarylamine O-acetyltransferase
MPHADRPRNHMTLVVKLNNERYLCDVGIGIQALIEPMLLKPDTVTTRCFKKFRFGYLDKYTGMMQIIKNEQWENFCSFTFEPVLMSDLEFMHYYYSKSPSSCYKANV